MRASRPDFWSRAGIGLTTTRQRDDPFSVTEHKIRTVQETRLGVEGGSSFLERNEQSPCSGMATRWSAQRDLRHVGWHATSGEREKQLEFGKMKL